MNVRSVHKHIKMSPRKLRRVIDRIRGLNVPAARNILRFMPYAAARVVEKDLLSAIANAEVKWNIDESNLTISKIFADEGPTFKRWRPRAQGRAYTRLKRTAHLTIIVEVNE